MNIRRDMISVLVVSDNPYEADELRKFLQFDVDYGSTSIGHVHSGEDALQQVFELQPDVVLYMLAKFDSSLSNDIVDLCACAPETSIVMLCPEDAIALLPDQLSGIVRAILPKPQFVAGVLSAELEPSWAGTLLQAIHQVRQSRLFKRLTHRLALDMAQEIGCDIGTLDATLDNLLTRNLIDAFNAEDARCWVAITPKGDLVLSGRQTLIHKLSDVEHGVLRLLQRLIH